MPVASVDCAQPAIVFVAPLKVLIVLVTLALMGTRPVCS